MKIKEHQSNSNHQVKCLQLNNCQIFVVLSINSNKMHPNLFSIVYMDADWHNSMYQMTESVYTMYALVSKVGYDNHFLGHNEAVLWYACTEEDWW